MRYTSLALIVCFAALSLSMVGCAKKTASQQPEVTVAQEERGPFERTREQAVVPNAKGGGKDTEPPSFEQIMEDQLGLPIYPGAESQNDFSTGSDSDGNKVIVASFTSRDSFDKVMAFYRKELKGYKESPETTENGSRFSGFRKSSKEGSGALIIEKPAKGPVRIAITVTKAGQGNPIPSTP